MEQSTQWLNLPKGKDVAAPVPLVPPVVPEPEPEAVSPEPELPVEPVEG